MAGRIKVLIVDDHPLFRRGLREVIEADARFDLIAEAGDGNTALQLIQEQKPDVSALDVNLPGLSGLEIARKLQGKRLPTRIIILTMYKDEETFNRAMDFGVKGFVLKENAVEDILNGIAAALAAKKPGLEDLTKAERRILKLVAEKKTSRQIAAELFISVRTVEAHRANISAKLELSGSHCLLISPSKIGPPSKSEFIR